jgi:chemotaxis protein MotA
MATTAESKANPAAEPAGKPAPGKARSRAHPDLATLGGIALATAGIIGGLLLEKGSISDVAQGTAAMIVLGGTFGAVLVTTPMSIVVRAFKGLGAVFFERSDGLTEVIEALIVYAGKARKHGIVSLESEAAAIEDPFLRKALNLAVDGTDMQELRKMMEIDIALSEHGAESEARVWESAGGYAPTIGIIGAVMGLIQVMKHLEDIKEVGHGIAVAFVATVYGVGLANIFFLPAANKLKARLRDATLRKDMILEGVIGIVEGLNPTLIRMKLEAYQTESSPAKKKKPAAAEGSAPASRGVPEPAAAKG